MSPASYRTAPPRVGVLSLYELPASNANRLPDLASGRPGLPRQGPAGRNLTGMTEVVIYTDGACSGNAGRLGCGVVLQWQDKEREMYGGDPLTTNNRMELM